MREFKGKVFITPHAKEKFIKRRLLTNKYYNPSVNVYKKKLNMIFRSRLLKYLTKENGKLHDYRENNGVIFICERNLTKNYWESDLVTIITVELTIENLKILKNDGVDIKELNIGDYMENKLAI